MQADLFDIEKAWQLLAVSEGDPVCQCEITGESWRFVGYEQQGYIFEHWHHPVSRCFLKIIIRNGRIACNA